MISVCMATYNGERFIRQQLESILLQLAPGDELVISDDSSTDATLKIITSLQDSRIRLFAGQSFRSPVRNFEFALKQVRGEIILLSDQDDIWLPNKVATVRGVFARNTARPLLVVLDATVVAEDEREICPSVLVKLKAGRGFWKNLYDNRYLGCCMAFSRDLLERALPFPPNIPMHDIWLGQLCERIGTTQFIPVVTMKYRKHSASLTDFKVQFKPLLQIRRRLLLAWHLAKRMLLVTGKENTGTGNGERGAGNEKRGTWNGERGAGNRFDLDPQTPNLDPRTPILDPQTSNLDPRSLNLISIVMPSLNQARFLEEAVRSVLDQTGIDVELLVMDPGSTDGSRQLLLQLQVEYGARLCLIFEADSGQSDAVNRGMARSRGNILGWLNSDDRLEAGVLARVVQLLDTARPAWLYGQGGVIDADGKRISSFIVTYKNWRGARFSRWKLLTENFIPQMAVFWNRAMWEKAGGLDCAKHLDMDYDLWLRFAALAEPVVLLEELAAFRVHGAAKGSRFAGQQLDAALTTARSHAGGLGRGGNLAVILHRLLSLRTRIIYRFLKP